MIGLAIAVSVFFVAPQANTATTHERVLEPPSAQLASADLPKSIWRIDGTDGIHLQSTLVCPGRAGSLDRNKLIPFDNFGLDVGCNYDGAGIGRVTIYLTRRRSDSLNDDLTRAKAALEQNMSDATLVGGAAPAPSGASFLSALYTRSDGSRTGVWVADISGWTLKFRATYDPRREKDIVDAMSALAGKTSATAGIHLSACAGAAPVGRTGSEITNQDRIMGLSIIAMVGSAADDDAKDKPQTVIGSRWCAEESIGDNEAPMLFWRDIASPGGPDRVSLMTMGEAPILLSSDNPTASLVDEEATKSKTLIYQLSGTEGNTTAVFAFFQGRPAASTLSPIAKAVFLGQRGAITSYDGATNTITVPGGGDKPGS